MGRKAHPRGMPRQDSNFKALLASLEDLPRSYCNAPHKERYRSLKAAETAANKQWWADRRVLKPYPCSDHWHLTSQGCDNSWKDNAPGGGKNGKEKK